MNLPHPTKTDRSGNAPEWFGLLSTDAPTETGVLTLSGDGADVISQSFGPEQKNHLLFEGFLFDLPAGVQTEEHLIRGYQEHGLDLFEQLRGRFLLAIWDHNANRGVVGHDAMGLHPLYVAESPSGTAFSSNIFALAYSGLIPRSPNRLSLAMSLTILHPPLPGHTHFAEIKRVPPGHFVIIEAGQVRQQCYWEIVPKEEQINPGAREARETFEELLQKAVRRCLTQVPQGILLSGGLDSISVAAIACHHRRDRNEPPPTACAAFNPPDYPIAEDETQRKVAAHLKMPLLSSHAYDWIGKENMVDRTLQLAPCFPGGADYWWAGVNIGFHRFLVDRGITSVLTGSGGDEWMGVHPAVTLDLVRSLSFRRLFKLLHAKSVSANLGWKHAVKAILWTQGLVKATGLLRARMTGGVRAPRIPNRQAWMIPDEALALQVTQAIGSQMAPILTEQGRVPNNFYRHALHYDWRNPRMFWELERQFHVGRVIGMTYLHPYHDRDLVAYCNRLPADVFFEAGANKSLVRPLVKKLMSGLNIEKQRKYADTPRSYLKDQLKQGVPNELGDRFPRLNELGLIDIGNLPDTSRGGVPTRTDQIYLATALSLERWCQNHFR